DGHHRHESPRPRAASFIVDSTFHRAAAAFVGGHVLAPTAGTLDMRQAMYYSLSLPVSTVIIGCDSIAQLEENAQLAREFTPLSAAQMALLTGRTESIAKQA